MGAELIHSPASGRIMEISDPQSDPGIEGIFTRVSIFLALWDDHTTRSPISGRIDSIHYTPGKFGLAFFKKNLLKNENNLIWLSVDGERLAVRQVAGRIARRIICDCKEGQAIRQGQKVGAITFGSCVQIYIPRHHTILAHPGQRVTSGKTVLALRP